MDFNALCSGLSNVGCSNERKQAISSFFRATYTILDDGDYHIYVERLFNLFTYQSSRIRKQLRWVGLLVMMGTGVSLFKMGNSWMRLGWDLVGLVYFV